MFIFKIAACECVASCLHFFQIYHQFLFLFHYRHGKRCVSITISYVVSQYNAYKFTNFDPFDTYNLKSICLSAFRFPFDANTPFGYFVAFSLQYIAFLNISYTCTITVCFGAGGSLIMMSMAKDIKNDLFAINEAAATVENPTEVTHKLNEFIQFHSDAKQLSKTFYVNNKPTINVYSTFI